MPRAHVKRQPTPPRRIGYSKAELAEAKADKQRTEGRRAFITQHGHTGVLPPDRLLSDMGDTVSVGAFGDGPEVAVRVVKGWQPEAMLARGLITPRQHDAAQRLMEDFDAAGFDKVKGQSWGEIVDAGSAPSSDVPHRLAMQRRAVMDKLRALPAMVREVVEHVVLAGRTVETAGATLKAQWLPSSKQLRTVSARAYLGLGLELVADAYGIF